MMIALAISACESSGDGAPARPEGRREAAAITASSSTALAAPDKPVQAPASDSHSTIIAEMKRVLVGAATMDGAPITDVRVRSTCRTTFVNAGGATEIDWAKVGNVAPRVAAGHEINVLPSDTGNHELSIPTSASGPTRDDADDIRGAVGLLAADCGAVG